MSSISLYLSKGNGLSIQKDDSGCDVEQEVQEGRHLREKLYRGCWIQVTVATHGFERHQGGRTGQTLKWDGNEI